MPHVRSAEVPVAFLQDVPKVGSVLLGKVETSQGNIVRANANLAAGEAVVSYMGAGEVAEDEAVCDFELAALKQSIEAFMATDEFMKLESDTREAIAFFLVREVDGL